METAVTHVMTNVLVIYSLKTTLLQLTKLYLKPDWNIDEWKNYKRRHNEKSYGKI